LLAGHSGGDASERLARLLDPHRVHPSLPAVERPALLFHLLDQETPSAVLTRRIELQSFGLCVLMHAYAMALEVGDAAEILAANADDETGPLSYGTILSLR
jgi:hypothetical protein